MGEDVIGWYNKDVEYTRSPAQKCGNIQFLVIFVCIVVIIIHWMFLYEWIFGQHYCFGVFGFWIIIWLWFHVGMSENIRFQLFLGFWVVGLSMWF
jgi:hypothetical protein